MDFLRTPTPIYRGKQPQPAQRSSGPFSGLGLLTGTTPSYRTAEQAVSPSDGARSWLLFDPTPEYRIAAPCAPIVCDPATDPAPQPNEAVALDPCSECPPETQIVIL